jgi:allophanate hydrolase subunit 2
VPREGDGAIAVVPGPHHDRFSAAALRALLSEEFRVLPESDRVGVRLEGPALVPEGGELLTTGVVAGAIQVPSGGAPIVLLADRGTTGGYPIVATVIGAHLGRVAQAVPGASLRFYEVDRERAREELRAERRLLVPASA